MRRGGRDGPGVLLGFTGTSLLVIEDGGGSDDTASLSGDRPWFISKYCPVILCDPRAVPDVFALYDIHKMILAADTIKYVYMIMSRVRVQFRDIRLPNITRVTLFD